MPGGSMWMPSRRGYPALILLLVLALLDPGLPVGSVARAAEPAGILDGFPRAQLTLIQQSGRCLSLDVAVAATEAQRARGLMYVTALDEFEGMYFPWPEPAWISMWMKNTYISLDMAFVREDGHIAGIAAGTTPLSLETIPSPEPVTGVLEVAAGFTARWDVRPGDRVELGQAGNQPGAGSATSRQTR
jgi:uncharacterized membrane protein (UPF0127 family)